MICKLSSGSQFYDSNLSSLASGQLCHLNRTLLIITQRNLECLDFTQTKAVIANKLGAFNLEKSFKMSKKKARNYLPAEYHLLLFYKLVLIYYLNTQRLNVVSSQFP